MKSFRKLQFTVEISVVAWCQYAGWSVVMLDFVVVLIIVVTVIVVVIVVLGVLLVFIVVLDMNIVSELPRLEEVKMLLIPMELVGV